MPYGTNDPEALARLKELQDMTAEAKAAIQTPAPEQINEYWVVECGNGNYWWVAERHDHAYSNQNGAFWDIKDTKFIDAQVRIVHYTGTGAEVVALWDEKGVRVK